jgi:hypothetical protein
MKGSNPPKSQLTPFQAIAGLALLIFVVWIVVHDLTASEDRFAVGDCLHFQDGKYKGADCDERKAQFKVYATKDDTKSCVEVPGTSSAYYEPTSKGGTRWFCIGDKDVDLAKAINDVDTDDCVVTNDSSAEKAPCNAPDSRPVLKVLKDVNKISVNVLGVRACVEAGAEKAKLMYSWGLEDAPSPYAMHSLSWDRVLCLGARA